MTTQDKDFLPLIWTAIECHNNSTNDFSKKKIKEALKDCLKKWSDQPVKMVSETVYKLAEKKGIDPFELMWPDRNVFGKINNKSLIVWEHTTPLNELYLNLINSKNINEVEKKLSNYSGVCWISREEDQRLNENKYRSVRPNGWKKCYELCGIKIIFKK